MRHLRITQSTTVLCLTLLCSTCRRDRPTALTAPTAPTAPTGPGFTLSGVITDRVSGRPISGAAVGLVPQRFPSNGPWSFAPGPRSADATGHYSISGLPDWTGTAWVAASKDGYMQQCVTTATIQADTSRDVELTPIPFLAVDQSPATTAAAGSRTISGTVYEVISEGRRPVENAWIGWEAAMDFVAAQTMSDAAGRYLLCGLPEQRIDSVFAVKQGYNNVKYVSVDPGTDVRVDIEIGQR